jgi:hypothetical protein
MDGPAFSIAVFQFTKFATNNVDEFIGLFAIERKADGRQAFANQHISLAHEAAAMWNVKYARLFTTPNHQNNASLHSCLQL